MTYVYGTAIGHEQYLLHEMTSGNIPIVFTITQDASRAISNPKKPQKYRFGC